MRRTSTGASPTDGSSISRMRGADIRARASASICCSPPLMLPASWLRRSFSAGTFRSKVQIALRSPRARAAKRAEQRFSSPLAGEKPAPLGHEHDAESTIASVVMPIKSWRVPSISATMVPADGRTMPITHFISVLLPLPLVPSSATVSPPRAVHRDVVQHAHRAVAGIDAGDLRLLAKIGPLDVGLAHHLLRQRRRRSCGRRPARPGAAEKPSPPA